MNKPKQESKNQASEQASSQGGTRKPAKTPHAPGGPGWISEHSLLLWAVATVLVISAFVIYMIIDN